MIADRLNPIVLKELRQGLKSRSFVASFLGLQVLMVVSMFIYVASVTTVSGDMQFADGFFWFMLGIMLLLFMPLRAFGALYGEVKEKTLELLFLTRMTSWDIAFGKWLALLLQIGLLICAVLPYLVLRYYLGSVDVTADLIQLGLQVLLSALLVAIGVGLSAWTSKLLRGLLIFWALSSLYTLPFLLFGVTRSGMRMFAFWSWVDVLVWLLVCGLVMLYFVEYGASQIAPPAENHSLRKRGFVLGITLLMVPHAVFGTRDVFPLAWGLGLLIPAMVDLLCEPVYGIGSLYRPLKKWGPLRWLLYPGWPSSLLVLVLALGVFVGAEQIMNFEEDFLIWVLVLFNILLFPFPFIRLFRRWGQKPLLSYLFIQTACVLLFVFNVILRESTLFPPMPGIMAVFPAAGLAEVIDEGPDDVHLWWVLIPTLVMLLVCFVKAVPAWRAMDRLAREADS